MKTCVFVCMCVTLSVLPQRSFAQARQSLYSNLANPAIGMNALFSGQVAPDIDAPYNFGFDSVEMSALSAVDPYWTFWANITFTDGEVDPEEIVARTNRIPGLELRLGKLRGKFGKHGLLHTHAFPFIQAPVIMENAIGEEGFKDGGLEASWLTPLPWYSELTAGVFQAMEASDENPLDFGSSSHGNVPFLGHFSNTFDLNDETTLELGQSYLQGEATNGEDQLVFGADLTVRNVPLRRSNSRGWIFQTEYIEKGSRANGDYTQGPHGWYAGLKYRLSQTWWVGVRGEQSRNAETEVLVDDAGDPIAGKITRGSANLTWAPSEFSYVRLEYSSLQADDGNGFEPNDNRLSLQMSYTIGYHPAHPY